MSGPHPARLWTGFTAKGLCMALAMIGVFLVLLWVPVQRARVAAWRTADK
jgi:hypothetical protein